MLWPLLALGLVACTGAAPPQQVAATETATTDNPSDTLPQRYQPIANRILLGIGALAAIQVSPTFTYVGGHRFILGGTADAEQHLFVLADSSKTVQRLFWIQMENFLPTESGSYDYSADSVVTVHGFRLAANQRVYSSAPDPLSDRARAFGLIESRGFRIPDGATRVRLIYLPEQPARREVMIIYVEPRIPANADSDSQTALLARAASDLMLHRNP
jgi:hypothetical protein